MQDLRRPLATAAVLVGLTVFGAVGTWSAFSATTANPGNHFAAGTVILSDNDSGVAMLGQTNMAPGGAGSSACVNVRYDGDLPARVRLYGSTGGSGLDPYLDVTVVRGTLAGGAFPSCAQFTPDTTDHAGLGAGVVFEGTLQELGDSWSAGLDDPVSGDGEDWTSTEEHAFKVTVGPRDDATSQGQSATQTFTWEARDLGAYPGTWTQPGPALNNDPTGNGTAPSITNVGGTPWVAWAEDDNVDWNIEIRVTKLNGAGTGWTEVVGGASPIDHDPTRDAHDPSIADVGGVPWVAWSEWDGTAKQIRVSRLNGAGTAWTEVAGGASPINHSATRDGAQPIITDIGGIPWVAWRESDGVNYEVRVAKLNGAGTGWTEVVGGASPINHSATQSTGGVSLVEAGGTPYVGWVEVRAGGGNDVRVAKLNGAGDDWLEVGGPLNSGSADTRVGLSVDQDRPLVAWSEYDGSNFEARVAKLDAGGSTWTEIVGGASPINHSPTKDASSVSLVMVGGLPVIAWLEEDGTTGRAVARVARLNAAGDDWQEVIGGSNPISVRSDRDSEHPTLAAVNGTPWLTWAEYDQGWMDQARVARP
jgi:hypothetical protein